MNVDSSKFLIGQIGIIAWAFDGVTLFLALMKKQVESTVTKARRGRAQRASARARVANNRRRKAAA